MVHRSLRYKLSPSVEQERQFRQFAGVCRLIYNLALEQRRVSWRQYQRLTGSRINYVAQARELTALRAEYDWIAAVSQACQQQALRDLDTAFVRFFKGVARYPTPRRKGVNDSFRFQGREVEVRRINHKWSVVRLPKVGWVRFRDTRPLRGIVRNVTVSRDPLGWHISFACEIEHIILVNLCPAVGIDRGVVNTITLSTGERLSMPHLLEALERKRCGVQRVLARKRHASARRAKTLRRLAKLSARVARIRRDWQHKVTLAIGKRFGTVVLEDLKIRNMTASARGTVEKPGRNVRQKAGLNRSILKQSWFGFETTLHYKLEERGGALVKVNPAYTSQTCSECGTTDSRSRENQARFVCRHCGFRAHADHNAAINILRRNTAFMRMEEGHRFSVEVRTGNRLIPAENPPVSTGGRC